VRHWIAFAALALAAPPCLAEGPEANADQWMTRMAESLRIGASLTATAHMEARSPGEEDLSFDMKLLRDAHGGGTRTLFEMREKGDPGSTVSELLVMPGEPLTNWYWDLRKRRWLSVKGLLPTDPFADTLFRYEDLWLADPSERRKGSVRFVEEGGRRFAELESPPYHYYQRVVTRIDPETGLPLRVRFYDNAGAPIREQSYEAVTEIEGKPFPTVVRLKDLVTGAESVLTWKTVHFGAAIPENLFDLSAIDDRIRKGVEPVPLTTDR
jgi:hypothetical protein